MRKSTLLLSALIGCSTWAIASEPSVIEIPANFDAWNLNFQFPLEKLPLPENKVPSRKQSLIPGRLNTFRKDATGVTEYFAVAQKFHRSYTFMYDGGDIITYPIDIKVDGDQVTISKLFNLEAQSTDWSKGVDYDVTGTYDASTGTITIPTPSNFNNATIAGLIGDYYTEVLVAGTVTEDGKLVPKDNLVLKVTGDFEAISTDDHFGIMNYTNDGSTIYGTQALYRGFYATLPSNEPKLIAFNESYIFGDSFPNQGTSGTFSVVNVSDVDVDFVTEVESDDDSFSVNPEAGSIAPRSVQDFTVSFLPKETGEYEGMLMIEYDGDKESTEPIYVLYGANAVPTPDYSEIIKNGAFNFMTNIEFPFEMVNLADGTRAARSTTNGQFGTSKLTVEFEVPEGNLGVFSWKGESVNENYWYQNAGGYFIDDADEAAFSATGTTTIDGSLEFAPGKHSVRFQYDGLAYTGNVKNGLYVYDLELVSSPADALAVVIETPEVILNNLLITDESGVSAEGRIIIRNKGLENLGVSSIKSSDSHFVASAPNVLVGMLETIEIPVIFNTLEPGEYNSEITIDTTAGIVTANVKVIVRKMADFTSVVTEGSECVTGFSTDASYPFEVENGVAYNVNSGEADEVATNSWFQIDFTIPDGKMGYIHWDGVSNGNIPDPTNTWGGDYTYIEIHHPLVTGGLCAYGENADAGSTLFTNTSGWENYLTCVPGDHYVKFAFQKNGDGIISERDRVELSNFRIEIKDFKEFDVEADKTELEFEPIYVGDNRYLTATVNLKNTGSNPLEIIDCTSDHPFYGVVPDNLFPVQWDKTQAVTVWFYPSEEGEFEGTVTFNTNAGPVDIHCYGTTKEAEGILLIGDVENDASDGWSFYDADRDGNCWSLGTALWYEMPEWVHSGVQCFGSPSWDQYGAMAPDNWLFSPAVLIPEDGAMLRWYAAAHHHERYAEHYSVYITTPEQIANPDNLNSLEAAFSETLTAESADVWQERTIDLADYASENIIIAFRHHETDGQYVLKIDDIFVYEMDKWNTLTGVESVNSDANVVSTEIYDLNGLRKRGLMKGVNIIRTTLSDGSVKTSKIIVK